jgi:hypothetical protein
MALRYRLIAPLVSAALLTAALAYLRDPPWLISVSSGMRAWEMDTSGRRYRWTGGHASLFVPADARLISIPLRTTFDSPGDPSITVSIAIDDRPVDRIVLTDPQWRLSTVRLPPKGSRQVRRVDIRVDRTRDDNRGAAVGAIVTTAQQ